MIDEVWLNRQMEDYSERKSTNKRDFVNKWYCSWNDNKKPIFLDEAIKSDEEISEDMARQGEFFALQIKGDSMEPKISDGDVVIVRKQPDVESGEIAIVLVNGDEATIKKVQKFTGGINLVPSNPVYEVKTFTNEQIEALPVQILGKVVELRAKF